MWQIVNNNINFLDEFLTINWSLLKPCFFWHWSFTVFKFEVWQIVVAYACTNPKRYVFFFCCETLWMKKCRLGRENLIPLWKNYTSIFSRFLLLFFNIYTKTLLTYRMTLLAYHSKLKNLTRLIYTTGFGLFLFLTLHWKKNYCAIFLYSDINM